MASPLDELLMDPGDVGDVYRQRLDDVPRPTETADDTSERLVKEESQRARVRAIKGRDLAARDIPTYTDASGEVQPVRDEQGAALTQFDQKNKIGYDSAGNPRQVVYGEAGAPELRDPFAGIPEWTDPKSGDKYKRAPGLAWMWTGKDEDIAAQNEQAQQDRVNRAAAEALGRKLTLDEHELNADQRTFRNRAKAFAAANGIDDLSDPEATRAKLDEAFNSEYAAPEANDKHWFTDKLTDQAQQRRADIDRRKAEAFSQLDDLQKLHSSISERKARVDQQAGITSELRGKVAQSALKKAGIELPQDGDTTAGGAGGANDSGAGGANGQPAPKPEIPMGEFEDASGLFPEHITSAIAAARSGQRAYTVDDKGGIIFQPGKLAVGAQEALKDGLVSEEWAKTHAEDLAKHDQEYADLEKSAGGSQVLKALARGAGKGAAFMYGAKPGAAAGAALGALIPGADLTGIPEAVLGAIGGLTTGTLAAMAADKTLEKLGKYSETAQSLNDSAKLHPVAAGAGELLAFGTGAPKALSNLYRAGQIAAVDGGLTAAATTVAKQLGGAAAGGAAFEGVLRPTFDAARYAVADQLGIPHDQFQGPTAESLGTNVGLAVLLAGHSIKFRDYTVQDMASILTRAKVRADAGIDPTAETSPEVIAQAFAQKGINLDANAAKTMAQPLSPQEVDLYAKMSNVTARMEAEGKLPNFSGAKQASVGGKPIATAVERGEMPEDSTGGGGGSQPLPGPTRPQSGRPEQQLEWPHGDVRYVSRNEEPIATHPATIPAEARALPGPTRPDSAKTDRMLDWPHGDARTFLPSGEPIPMDGRRPLPPDDSALTTATQPGEGDAFANSTPVPTAAVSEATPSTTGEAPEPEISAAQLAQEGGEKQTAVPAESPSDPQSKLLAERQQIERYLAEPPKTSVEAAMHKAQQERLAAIDEQLRQSDNGTNSRALEAPPALTAEPTSAPLIASSGAIEKPADGAELTPSSIDTEARRAATSPHNELPHPTEGQKVAGNYQKGHVRVGGLDISIENPAGSERSGTDSKGKPWSVEMQSHYGYIRGSKGRDGDHIDVFVKPGTPEDYEGPVFVINQQDKAKSFDEHKAVIGAANEREAKQLYRQNYSGVNYPLIQSVAEFPTVESFKDWATGARQRRAPVKSPTIQATTEAPKPEAQTAARTVDIQGKQEAGAPADDSARSNLEQVVNSVSHEADQQTSSVSEENTGGDQGLGASDPKKSPSGLGKEVDEKGATAARVFAENAVAESGLGATVGLASLPNSAGLETTESGISIDPAEAWSAMMELHRNGGDAAGWLKAIVDEELWHWRQVLLQQSDFHPFFERLMDDLVAKHGDGFSKAVSEAYGPTERVSDYAYEFARMVAQHRSGRPISESFHADLSELMPFIEAEQPDSLERHLDELQTLTVDDTLKPGDSVKIGMKAGKVIRVKGSRADIALDEGGIVSGKTDKLSRPQLEPELPIRARAANPFEALRKTYDQAAEELKAQATKDKIVAGHDATQNIPNVRAQQAKSSITLDIPDARDREAAPFVVEADGNKAELQKMRSKIAASKDTELAKKYVPIIDHAIANADRLRTATKNHDAIMRAEHAAINGAGIEVGDTRNYVRRVINPPDAVSENLPKPLFSGGGGGGSPTGIKKGRVFDTLADAIQAGYKPASTDIADLAANRVEAGQKLIEQKAYLDGLRSTASPTDGKPIIGKMEQVKKLNGETEQQIPKGYSVVQMGGRPEVVHDQFAGLFRNLYGQSALRNNTVWRGLMKAAAVAKHGTLVMDTFHVGRMLFKMATGRGGLPFTVSNGKLQWNLGRGRALLEYSDADLNRAVAAGEIDGQQARYARTMRPLLDELMNAGMNVGRVADNLYEQSKLHIPVLDSLNHWIFGKLTRSAMVQTALTAFDRNLKNKAFPTREAAARQTAKEMNELFGNLQNQGVFKSKTMQDLARLVFLAPQWTESQFRNEARSYAQFGTSAVNAARGKGFQLGNSALIMATGFSALLLANQAINYLTKGKSTFENEDGHKLDAFIPGGKRGFWFNPFEIAGEYSHAAEKYLAQHEHPVDVAAHIVQNKLSPMARGVSEAISGRDYSGRKFLDNGDRFTSAVVDALPSPMPLTGVLEKDPRQPFGYRLNRQPGSLTKQALSSVGMKVSNAQSPRSEMFALAYPFRADKQRVDVAGEYTELRRALDNDNLEAAKSEIQWLAKQGKTADEIKRAVGFKKDGSVSPEHFAGNADRERDFVKSLTPEQRSAYDAAQRDHRANAQKLVRVLREVKIDTRAKGSKPRIPMLTEF